MEQPPQNSKESGVNRVVGHEPDREKELLNYFKNKLETNSLGPKEIEMTEEQRSLLERMNHQMHDFLVQYGIEAIEIAPTNVHILDTAALTEAELKEIQNRTGTEHGFYNATLQGIGILKDYDESKLSFFQTLVHEILHLQGFYSYQKSTEQTADLTLVKGNEEVSMNIRRSGFSIGTTNGRRLLFHKLNESVITELEIRFEESYMAKWPELEEELRDREEKIRIMAERENIPAERIKRMVSRVKGDENIGYKWVSYPYHDERERLNSLVEDLYERNMDDFGSREDVFRLFAEATMTGRLMPIARLIEKTFGKGTFRIIGEASADKPE